MRHSGFSASSAEWLYEDNLDVELQRAATVALGDRRGAIIVLDPQSGRVRAVVNSKIAFEETFRPGSTIKPFTALAALRSGLIDEESRTLCGEEYYHGEFHTTCSHPRDLPPLNPTEAIAYSCNYYFGRVGERLNESSFNSTLSEFGFGKPTGLNGNREAQGKVLRNEWRSQSAMGAGDYLQTTPIQLINAYSALVNGGHLFDPHIASAAGFVPELQANLAIKAEHRIVIIKGMRGAVRYGSAESAHLYSLPIYIFGKTGTASQINGFRTQGWFVGFASDLKEGEKEESEFAPEKVKLAVLVFLTKSHGVEAAQVARPILEAYARSTMERRGDLKTPARVEERTGVQREDDRSSGQSLPLRPFPPQVQAAALVRVHMVRENITRTMSLEDYVRGVVAAEGSMEREPEALKALAIASRTYALKNIGRHAQDGYDFCTTTHCQRYHPANSDSNTNISPAVIDAVEATKGEVLREAGNQLADSYFSASCGGATANIATLWGARAGKAPSYLRGVRDEYCESEAHHSWTDVISQTQLLQALQSDPRTNIGNRLVDVRVLRTDASGRAELITVEGDRRLTVGGWDFKIIVGRALGWNLLKSSRFEIAHTGSDFVFRGSGFGHGLGLCQEGAHVMATRGATYRQILAKYFPGTDIARGIEARSWDEAPGGRDSKMSRASILAEAFCGGRAAESVRQHRSFADLLWNNSEHFEIGSVAANPRFIPATKRRTLSSEDFRISYPGNVSQSEVEGLLSFLQSSRRSLIERIAGVGITVRFPVLEIFVNETTGDFVGRTGQPVWVAAATKDNRIELQPIQTLRRRRILETTLRHELVHKLVEVVGRGRTPRWLAEGLAVHFAGEGSLVARYQPRQRMTTYEIEQRLINLEGAQSASDMRVSYAAAYGEVKRLIKDEGEANVWRRVAR